MKAADIALKQIRTHDHNPRRDAVADDDMVASVAAAGVLQAVTVAPAPDSPSQDPANPKSRWVLLAGHRRFDACVKAKLATIPAVVREDLLTDTQQLEAMCIENLHRIDLTPVEEAHAYEQLQLFGMTPAAIAKATGRNAKTVKARLALVGLPETAQQRIHDGQLRLDQAATLVDFHAEAPDIAAELEEHVTRKDWDYLVNTAKQKLQRRRDNAEQIAQHKALGAVECHQPLDNWLPLYRFPEALQDPDQHPDCLGYIAYGEDSYSRPMLLCRNVTAHDLPKDAPAPTLTTSSSSYHEDAATRAQRDAEWEERRRLDAEKRAARAAATEARLRWLHTHIRGTLGKASTRTPLLESLVPILLTNAPEYGYGPDQVKILAAHLVATGKDPGPLLYTGIASSDTTREAEANLWADLPGITGTVRVESAYAAWLTAWVDYALTTDLVGLYEDGHLTIFTHQLDLWTYITDQGYALTEVDEDEVARITGQSMEAAGDASTDQDDESSEAGQ